MNDKSVKIKYFRDAANAPFGVLVMKRSGETTDTTQRVIYDICPVVPVKTVKKERLSPKKIARTLAIASLGADPLQVDVAMPSTTHEITLAVMKHLCETVNVPQRVKRYCRKWIRSFQSKQVVV